MEDQSNASTAGETTFANGPTSASGRIKVAEKDYDEETGTFSVVFANGHKSEVELGSLPPNIQNMLALHGLAQKLGDSYASVKGDVAAAVEKYTAVLNQLMAGEWKKAREAGEGGARTTELAAAIARFKNVEVERANAVVAKATPEQIKTWKGNAKIKAIIAEIRAENAKARAEKAGTTETSDELEGLEL